MVIVALQLTIVAKQTVVIGLFCKCSCNCNYSTDLEICFLPPFSFLFNFFFADSEIEIRFLLSDAPSQAKKDSENLNEPQIL